MKSRISVQAHQGSLFVNLDFIQFVRSLHDVILYWNIHISIVEKLMSLCWNTDP